MAELFDALGRPERSADLREAARLLQQRFNDTFWDEAGGFYAYCLDGEKRPVLTVASNVGHCLWSGIIRAARVVQRQNQMPELYAGLTRTPTGFPLQYVGANVPQAWAAGSVFMTLHAMLGMHPDAPNGRLFIEPALPPWLPDLTLMGLRLGQHSFDIRFWREGGATAHEVLRGNAAAVVRQCHDATAG